MKTIALKMPDGTVKEFKRVKNMIDSRVKIIEFDMESDLILADNNQIIAEFREKVQAETDIQKARELNAQIHKFSRDCEVMWICRGVGKAKLLIDTDGLTDAEIELINSDAKGEFWRYQELEDIKDFHSSF